MSGNPEDFWSNRFHGCALAAGFQALLEGRLDDSVYARQLTHTHYDSGGFRERVTPPKRSDG